MDYLIKIKIKSKLIIYFVENSEIIGIINNIALYTNLAFVNFTFTSLDDSEADQGHLNIEIYIRNRFRVDISRSEPLPIQPQLVPEHPPPPPPPPVWYYRDPGKGPKTRGCMLLIIHKSSAVFLHMNVKKYFKHFKMERFVSHVADNWPSDVQQLNASYHCL